VCVRAASFQIDAGDTDFCMEKMSHTRPSFTATPDHGQHTRVRWHARAARDLLDCFEARQPLSEFLEDFPTVTREQAVAAFEQAKKALLARARPLGDCLPRRLRREPVGHHVKTVPDMGGPATALHSNCIPQIVLSEACASAKPPTMYRPCSEDRKKS
jgi:hypothetical protein